MHVDDGMFITTSPTLAAEFRSAIRQRYGSDVAFHPLTTFCGVTITNNADYSIKMDMGKYIVDDLLVKCGMGKLPPALTPSDKDFFDPPTDLTPFDPTTFQSANGCLIHTLPIRHDIRKEVTYLCSHNATPTATDRTKQIRVLRYLKGCPYLGLTFSANPEHFPDGVTITGAADSSHACHSENGKSQSAHIIMIGTNNAPFSTYSSAEPANISSSPCESEYVSLGRLAASVMYFRQFANDLGYSQQAPSILYEDNQSAINLAVAPELPRKSRHILQRHHVLRFLQSLAHIKPMHQGTNDIIPDGMTKSKPPLPFLYFRSRLMGTPLPKF